VCFLDVEDANTKNDLKRKIIAYGGTVEDTMTDTVTHYITDIYPSTKVSEEIHIVNTQWVVDSAELGKEVPVEKYVISKEDE